MEGIAENVEMNGPLGWWREPKLNRALVAGLLLEVVFSLPPLPDDPEIRRYQAKARLKEALVSRLAGHIPLNSFRDLAQNLDYWFELFYPLIVPQTSMSPCSQEDEPAQSSDHPPLAEESLLREALARLNGLLPRRRHRKIDREKLIVFFRQRGTGWFRLRDFAQFFRMDRKTAWEYVQKLLQAGLLQHNQGRSAAVRYRLAASFLSGPQAATGLQEGGGWG